MGLIRNRIAVTLLGSAPLWIAACGGGGGGGASPAASTNATVLVIQNVNPATGPNVQSISVDSGLANNNVNVVFTNVTICKPTTNLCQTIDRVLVDTGSTGLRILHTALSASLSLIQQTDSSGSPVVECAQFASGYAWGPVKLADIKIAQEQANSWPIQVIGDPDFSLVPSNCSSGGPALNTSQTLGANGILGLGVFRYDCGATCASSAVAGAYYVCPAAGCQPTMQPLARQVQHPVAGFATNNNGVIIQLPAIPDTGASRVNGELVFGIGTQTNNGLANAVAITLNSTGNFTTQYNNRSFLRSFIDSGSNGVFFRDTSISQCVRTAGFYCPPATLNLTATAVGTNGAVNAVNFSVANLETLTTNNPTFFAFNNIGGALGSFNQFDFGLPFFFGRNVFVAIEGANTPAGPGPYFAF